MKREILFRGQRSDKKQWVEGDLIHGVGLRKGKMYILPLYANLASLEGCDPLDGYNVIPETIGQFTGLTDKNGTKIFEGDIVKSWNSEYERPLICEYIHEYSCFAFIDKADYNNQYFWNFNDCSKSEVIGNVHDNPELLK